MESVLAVFARDEERQRNDRQSNKALEDALRHTQRAIEALTEAHAKHNGFSNNRNHKLLDALETAYYEAGEPNDTSEHHKSYYDAASDSWMHSVLTATQNRRSPTARLIFALEALWFSEFGERPTAYEPQFYIFAGYMLGISPNSVKKQRSRTVPPIEKRRTKKG
jgi:hypothetical protein